MTLPGIDLLASVSDTAWATDLLVALRAWSQPRAPHPETPVPDAYLALSPQAIHLAEALRSDVPVAVVIDEPRSLTPEVVERATVLVARDAETAARLPDAVYWRPEAIDAGRHPSIAPFVRQRWRGTLGLPDPWILEFDGHRSPSIGRDLRSTALALCSAAVVTGPELVTALALGTPVVTTPSAAARIDAEPDVHLVTRTHDRRDAAGALAADPPRAAAIGWGGRLLVEERFDLRTVAVAILDGLGIGPAPFPAAPLAGLDAELAALGTPADSPVATRIIRKVANLMPGADWADLTGRRR